MLAPRIADKAPRPATSRPLWAPALFAGSRRDPEGMQCEEAHFPWNLDPTDIAGLSLTCLTFWLSLRGPSVLVRLTVAMRLLWRRLIPTGLRVLSRIRPEPESAPGLSFETNFEGHVVFSETTAYAARIAWGVGVAVLLLSW